MLKTYLCFDSEISFFQLFNSRGGCKFIFLEKKSSGLGGGGLFRAGVLIRVNTVIYLFGLYCLLTSLVVA